MNSFRKGLLVVTLLAAPGVLAAQGSKEKGKLNEYGNPMKIPPRETSAAISEADLRTRLYIFADDSMMGRQINTLGNKKGTDYIAAEVKRLGLEPAGDNGTYFQTLPFAARYYSERSELNAGGRSFKWGQDVVSTGALIAADFKSVQVIYGGVAGDTANQIAPAMATGRFVVLSAAPRDPNAAQAGAGGRGGRGGRGGGGGGGGAAGGRGPVDPAAALRARFDSLRSSADRLLAQSGTLDTAKRRELRELGQQIYNSGAAPAGGRGGGGGGRGGFGGGAITRFTGAVAVATVDLDEIDAAQRAALIAPPRPTLQNPGPAPLPGQPLGAVEGPITLRITRAAAEQFMGVSLANLRAGASGKTVNGKLEIDQKISDHPEYARNVVAILRGSDPALRNQYVAIGGHNDHVGTRPTSVDHDSLHAYEIELYKMQMADGKTVQAATDSMRALARSRVNMAEIRKKFGPARMDSISNGADDDGSGSMAVLEIAEALSMAQTKPKRSVIFVWHTGEESGLQGSNYFTNHPTVPRDSIVSQINIDMIGRGRTDDLPGGGPDYLGVVGSNRLSNDLATMVSGVNAKQKAPLKLDYEFDEATEWAGYNNIYGRSDHANYARYNIPIAFFFTGLHRDYHSVTDEPQYIDYPHYNKIVNYIRDLMVEVGNGPRPKLNAGAAQ